jgi:hypothetical protein
MLSESDLHKQLDIDLGRRAAISYMLDFIRPSEQQRMVRMAEELVR